MSRSRKLADFMIALSGLGIALIAGSTPVRALEDAKAQVALEPREARVGDVIRVSVALPGDEPWVAQAPDGMSGGSELGPFRVMAVELGQPRALTLAVTPRETGELELPAFEARFRLGEREARVSVPAQKVSVTSLLGEGDATLADLKPPAELPVPWPWKTIILSAAGALALAAILWWLIPRLRKPRAAAPVPETLLPPGVTPDAWAHAELQALLARGLVEAGLIREFHIALSDLIRRYLELRFRVPALERTTEEIEDELPRAFAPRGAVGAVVGMLERCDRVKFAKHLPMPTEIAQTIDLARTVLREAASRPADVSELTGVPLAAGGGD